jgi:ubiquinol-cytochrome c reductase cytochrome b subunit
MICPEWYFLIFYAILRSIPDKLLGVVLMGLAIAILFVLPFIDISLVRGPIFRPFFQYFFWILIADVFLLGWVGTKPVEYPYVTISQFCTFFYFFSFLILIPLIGLVENKLISDMTKKV